MRGLARVIGVSLAILAVGTGVACIPIASAQASSMMSVERVAVSAATTQQLFAPDGKVHQVRWDKLCQDGTRGCYDLVTTEGIRVTAQMVADRLHIPVTELTAATNTTTYYEQITNDYKDCTAWFGGCGYYTDAKLVSYDWYNLVSSGNVWMNQYCSANTWTCDGEGPVYVLTNNHGLGTHGDVYGPQQYTAQGNNGTQTRYVETDFSYSGGYQFNDSCTGYLC